MSPSELARAIGIKQPSMHNIESGKTKKLRGDTLAGLCRVLNISPEALLAGAHQSSESLLHESELTAIWRRLTPEDRDHLLAIARALASRMTPRKTAGAPPSPSAAPSTTRTGPLTAE